MARKGKKKVLTSNRTLKRNEVAQDALVETVKLDSMIAKMEQTKGVAHSENTETTSIDMTRNKEDEETEHEKLNVIIQKIEDDEDIQELNGHNVTKEDQKSEKTPEADADNQECLMEEDDEDSQEDEDSMEQYDEEDTSEEENEENEILEDEDIKKDATNTCEDEDSEEDATNTLEDEDSEEDATEEEEEEEEEDDDDDDEDEKNAKQEKEIAEGASGKSEKCNEENMGALWKEKAKKSGERSRKKVKENSIDNDEDSKKDKMKEEKDNVAKEVKKIADGDGQNAEERNVEKLETSSKEKVKNSMQRRRKKKLEDRSFKKLASGAEDKPESSIKKKFKKRADCKGMIFMCSSQTKNDCYLYRVLGLPASKRDLMKKIYKGMRLFLYDIDLKLMYGIYKAAGAGGYNIESKAFKSQFPSQVRFTVFEDCLPVSEEKFKKAIKDNYFTRNKFDCQLTSSQVEELCKLFVPARKVNHSKVVGRGKPKNPTPARQERKRRQRGEDEMPKHRERNRRRRGDIERRSPLRDERWHHERPRKRQRDAITSTVAPLRQQPPPAPQPLIVPSYAYRSMPEVNVYRLDPYMDDRDPYRGGRDPHIDRRDPYREGLHPYIEHRDSSRDGRRLAPQDTYRRVPIVEHPDVNRPDRLVEYHDSYRRGEMLEYRGLRSPNVGTRQLEEVGSRDPYVSYRDEPSNLETSRRNEIVTRDPCVSYQDRPSYADTVYSVERHSRTGLVPEYRLAGPITDHFSTRGPLPEYRSRRTLSRY